MKKLLLTAIASTLFSGSGLAAGTLLCTLSAEPGTIIRVYVDSKAAMFQRAGKPPRFFDYCQINPSPTVYVQCTDNEGRTLMIRPDLSGRYSGMNYGELSCRATYE